MLNLPKSSLGFTLLETLLVAIIAIVTGTVLTGILVNNTGLFYNESSIVSGGLGLNDAVGEIDKNIRQASGVASGYSGTQGNFTTSGNTLVLQLPSTNSSGIISGTYDYLVVSKDTGNSNILRLQVFPNQLSNRQAKNEVLTPNFDSVQFSYLDGNGNSVTATSAVRVKMTLNILSKTGSIGDKSTSTTITSLRNLSS